MVLYGLRLTHLDWFERPTSAKFDEPELGAVATLSLIDILWQVNNPLFHTLLEQNWFIYEKFIFTIFYHLYKFSIRIYCLFNTRLGSGSSYCFC